MSSYPYAVAIALSNGNDAPAGTIIDDGLQTEALASEEEIKAKLCIHLPHLWRYGVRLSRNRDVADDLVQATFVRALERARQFKAGTRLDRWLFSILHSIWLNEVRAHRVRTGQGLVDAGDALALDGEREAEVHVLANQVLHLVDTLPESQRIALRLTYIEGLSYREVADRTRVPIGTVMSRLAAARTKISETVVAPLQVQ